MPVAVAVAARVNANASPMPDQPNSPATPNSPQHPGSHSGDGVVAERVKPKLKKPPLYKVLLLNDDYTPMEFVVFLLRRFFNMSEDKAEQIMVHIHTKGLGVCGVFPREIAETKVRLTMDSARQNEHPLQCTMELE